MHAALQVVEKQTFELPSLGEAWLIAQIAAVRVENRQYAVVAIAASDGLALGELQVCPGSLMSGALLLTSPEPFVDRAPLWFSSEAVVGGGPLCPHCLPPQPESCSIEICLLGTLD